MPIAGWEDEEWDKMAFARMDLNTLTIDWSTSVWDDPVIGDPLNDVVYPSTPAIHGNRLWFLCRGQPYHQDQDYTYPPRGVYVFEVDPENGEVIRIHTVTDASYVPGFPYDPVFGAGQQTTTLDEFMAEGDRVLWCEAISHPDDPDTVKVRNLRIPPPP